MNEHIFALGADCVVEVDFAVELGVCRHIDNLSLFSFYVYVLGP